MRLFFHTTTARPAPSRLLAWLLALMISPALMFIPSPAQAADAPFGHPMPGGNWTFVRGDAYLHYACKTLIPDSPYGALYRVHTATWHNDGWTEPGVYATISRYSDANVIHSVNQRGWLYGFAGTNSLLSSAILPDRLWIQGAYYGPPRPWTDGISVASLRTC